MTSDDFILSILHLGSNSMLNWYTYRSLYAIHQYVSIIRALSTWKSQDRQYNGHKRDKDTNTNRQNYAKKLTIQQYEPTKRLGLNSYSHEGSLFLLYLWHLPCYW